jgi:hypothetical protein
VRPYARLPPLPSNVTITWGGAAGGDKLPALAVDVMSVREALNETGQVEGCKGHSVDSSFAIGYQSAQIVMN